MLKLLIVGLMGLMLSTTVFAQNATKQDMINVLKSKTAKSQFSDQQRDFMLQMASTFTEEDIKKVNELQKKLLKMDKKQQRSFASQTFKEADAMQKQLQNPDVQKKLDDFFKSIPKVD